MPVSTGGDSPGDRLVTAPSPSSREQKELLAERGLHSDHVTVWRRVRPYASEMERPLRQQLKPTNDGWRIGETYIRVKRKRVYLHRAVDSIGATIDFLLPAKRDTVAAKRFQYSVPPGAFRSCAPAVETGRFPLCSVVVGASYNKASGFLSVAHNYARHQSRPVQHFTGILK